jgi:hypothetical protein
MVIGHQPTPDKLSDQESPRRESHHDQHDDEYRQPIFERIRKVEEHAATKFVTHSAGSGVWRQFSSICERLLMVDALPVVAVFERLCVGLRISQ